MKKDIVEEKIWYKKINKREKALDNNERRYQKIKIKGVLKLGKNI